MGRKKKLTRKRLLDLKNKLNKYLKMYESPLIPIRIVSEEYVKDYWSKKYKIEIIDLPTCFLKYVAFAHTDNKTIILNKNRLEKLKDIGNLITVLTHEIGHFKGLTHEHPLMKINLEDYMGDK